MSLIPLWKILYNLIDPYRGDIQGICIFLFILISVSTFLLIAACLPVFIGSMSKDNRLWRKIKKNFPIWAKSYYENGVLSVYWHEGYKDSSSVVHNYKFDLKNNHAKFYDSSDNDCVWFEGTINEGVTKLI